MNILDLEQKIMDCWHVIDDIQLTTDHFVDSPDWEGMDPELCDALMNKYLSLKELYDLKFRDMWNTFEKVCVDYHAARRLAGKTIYSTEEIFQPIPDDPDNVLMNLPPEICEQAGFKPGDNVIVSQKDNGSLVITKQSDSEDPV